MADNEIKIKVVVDDSQEKKYYSESESRRKKSSASETEGEKRTTAQLKAELDERYARLVANLRKEVIARQQGKELAVKEAIKERVLLEGELKKFNASHRFALSEKLANTKATLEKEVALYKSQISQLKSAERTKLKGAIGSQAYVSQLISEQKKMPIGSQDYMQTGVLIDRYQSTLKKTNNEVKSLADQINGNLNNTLKGNVSQLLTSTGAYLGFGIAMSKATQLASESVQAYMKQETALRSLSFAIEKVRGGNKLYTEELVTFAEEQQSLVGINDDTIEQAQTYLVLQGRTNDQIKELVKTAIDLSAVQGDLSDENVIANIQKLDATYEGVTGKLGKYDSRIKALTQTQLENGDAVKLLGDKFKGTAEEVNKGTEGAWRKWVVGLSEAKETAGGVIVTLLTLNQKFSDMFDEVLNAQKGLQDFLGELVGLRREAQTPIKVTIDVEAPNLNNVWSQIQGLRQGTITDQLRTASWVTGKSWEEIMKVAKDNGWVGFAKELEAMGVNKSTNTGSNGTGSRGKEEVQKVLTFLEAFREKIKKLQEEIASLQVQQTESNLADYEKVAIYDELIAKQKELNDLMKVGGNFGLNAFIDESRSARGQLSGIGQAIQRRINPRSGNDPRQDMSSEEIDALLNGVELSFDEIKGIADSIVSPFQNILQLAGLTESAFGQILNMIRTVLDTGSGIFGAISSVLSFIPGGGAIGAIGGMAGGAMSGGMPRPQGMNFNPVIRIEGELSKLGTYKLVQQGNNYIAERGDGVY